MAKVWKAAMRDKRDQKVKMVPFLPAPPHPDQNLFFKRKKSLMFRVKTDLFKLWTRSPGGK